MNASLEWLALRVQLASYAGPSLTSEWRELIDQGLGGVCLFGSNLTGSREDVGALVNAMRGVRQDLLVATDEEDGDVTRLHVRDASPVPGAAVLGVLDDLELTRAVGAAVGADLTGVGIDLVLGPVADVNSNPDNPVIGTRSFGTEPGIVGRHVSAWVQGVQGAGVAACVKHFPGHGDTAQDSHLTLPLIDVGVEQLRTRELPPFAAAVAAGAASVMTSHLRVPALDPDLPATLSRPVLDVLRTDLDFDGAVVSDALDMAGVCDGRSIPEAAVAAMAAGADLLCTGPDKPPELVREIQAALVAAVGAGRLSHERLEEAAGRVARIRRPAGVAVADPPLDLAGRVRTAFDITGQLPDLVGARVVSVETEANIAVGPGRWGVTPEVTVAPGATLPEGPLVVQVRDAHRRPDVTSMLAAHAGPALVVEWGWPAPVPGSRHPLVATWGNSRPAITAVELLLTEAGWSR